jgi:hypothetical protein
VSREADVIKRLAKTLDMFGTLKKNILTTDLRTEFDRNYVISLLFSAAELNTANERPRFNYG